MNSNVNNRTIRQAIKAETGYNSVMVSKVGGCCRFYSDDEAVDLMLVEFDTIYVNSMNQYTTQQWVEEFKFNLKNHPEAIEKYEQATKHEPKKLWTASIRNPEIRYGMNGYTYALDCGNPNYTCNGWMIGSREEVKKKIHASADRLNRGG